MPDRRRFSKEAQRVVAEGQRRAQRTGATAVEPHHLLAAIAADARTTAGRTLVSAGLDPETIEEAADRDDRALLAAVGVHLDKGIAEAGPGATKPRFAPATKRSLELSLRVAVERGDKHIGAEHVLLGVLRLDTARIPQILEAAGTTPEELAASLEPART